MHVAWLPLLRCPVHGEPFDVDVTRQDGDDVVEAFLVGRARREVRVVISGIAVTPHALRDHLRRHGHVWRRTWMGDSRIVRFVLGGAWREGDDHVPFDEVRARYGDLMRPDAVPTVPPPDPADAALAAVLADHAPPAGRGIDVGCGVGRGAFVLAARLGRALGLDGSAARVRRARNVAVTQADFFLPPPPGAGKKEIPLDLARLARAGADFAVADGAALPLVEGAADVAVLRTGDGRGPWGDPGRVLSEACRVLAPGGLLVTAADAPPPAGFARAGGAGPLAAWRGP